MKTKHKILKGIIIGIGLIVIPIILMGTTNKNTSNEIGRYQISTTTLSHPDSEKVFETIFDTKSGKVISRKATRSSLYY